MKILLKVENVYVGSGPTAGVDIQAGGRDASEGDIAAGSVGVPPALVQRQAALWHLVCQWKLPLPTVHHELPLLYDCHLHISPCPIQDVRVQSRE